MEPALEVIARWSGLFSLVFLLMLPALARAHPALEEQIRHLSERIAAQPENADLYLHRGELHRIHGDWQAAQEDYERSRRLAPELTRVDLYLGKIWLEAGRLPQSIAALERYLGHSADDAEGWALLGRALRASEEPGEASIAFDRAIGAAIRAGRNPPPEWYLSRARSLVATGPGFRKQALQGLREGLAQLGEPVTLHLEALRLERDLRRTEAALSRLDHLQRSANLEASWLMLRAEVLEEAGHLGKARAALEQALSDLERVPPGRRRTGAYLELERGIREGLERLAVAEPRVESTVER
jgi:predicted Zn-dependent protease